MDIVEEIRQNPESGARRLAAEYKAGLMTLARRFCNDPGDAEELVNATFAAVVENIESHLEQASFFGWMCQILTSLHSRNVRRKSHGDIVYPGVVPDAIDEKAQQEIYDNLDHSLVREAIGKLTKEERDLLIMHYFMDMPVAQMAKVLALPSGTVMSKLYYARKALAAKLGIKAHEAVNKPGVKATLIALALCALTAAGAAVTATVHGGARNTGGRGSERAAATGGAGVAPRAAAIGETSETSGYSPIAPVFTPVSQDSPVSPVPDVPSVADVPFVADVPSTTLSKEQTMNTTTLRTIAASAAFAAATGAPLTASADDYMINVPLGETQTIDASLVAEIGAKNLVKTGRGTLVSSAEMAAYTGTITISEGAFEIKTTSDLGTADGSTIVEDGGTLLVNMTSGNERFQNEQFTIAGTGDAAYGAAVYQIRSNDRFKLFKYLTLSGDATIYAGTRLGVDGGTLAMDGHTLTLKGVNFQFRDVTYSAPIGNLVVESNTAFVRNQNATADPTKTLTITGNSGKIGFAEAYTTPSFWSLVVEDGGKIVSHTSSTDTWGSDVEWNAATEDGVTGLLSFTGTVTGTGTIKASNATLTFAKPLGASLGLDLSGTATAALAPAKAYSYEHKGLKTIHRNSYTADLQYFSDLRNDVTRYHCAYGPEPQLAEWPAASGNQSWCSRGYLWNREATNVTYTISCGCVYENWVYIDGQQVYYKKRDSGSPTYTFEMAAGTCVSIDIVTASGATGGPRSDADKFKINGVVANDPRGYYFTTNAVSVLETPALPALALADNGALDANGMAMSVAALAGGGIVTNVTTLTVSGSWTLAAADVVDGDALTVHGDLAFGNGCAFDVTGLSNLELGGIYTVCTADAITGFATTEITDGHYKCELVLTGNRIDLVSIPKAMVLGFR